MASCGFWLFLLGSRFFLSDLSLGWNELRHQLQRSLPAGTSASATGSFRDRGDGNVGSDITELQTPAQERRYTRSSFQRRRSAGNPGPSALGGCFQRQSASLIFALLTPCSLFWKFPGFFREQLLLAASQKGPPPPPAVPPSSSPARCLPPSLPSGRATCDFKKSSTPSSSWTITQKFTPAQNWLHNSAYCVQQWKHFQSDRPEPLEPLKKENCGGKKNNFGRRLSFFPCGSF